MNRNQKNWLTEFREWVAIFWLRVLVVLVVGFAAGAVLAAQSGVTLTVTVGQGNVPTATWSTSGVTSCTASGAWSGSKAPSGTQTLPAVTGTSVYVLTCQAAGDSIAALSWTAPTQNTDGSTLTNLAGYRIYRGNSAGAVASSYPANPAQQIANPATLTHTFTGLSPGTYYFAVSAYASSGAESALSAVGSKTIVSPTPASATETITVPKPPGLTVQQTTAYDVRQDGLKLVLGRPVGTVPMGSACSKDFELPGGYYRVERKAVKLDRTPRSAVIVAECA